MYGISTQVLKILSNLKHLRICLRMVSQTNLKKNSMPEASAIEDNLSELYPPIEDVSKSSKLMKDKADWHLKIKNLPTIEQKIVELNMPKYYGYFSVLLKNETMNLSSGNFIKFATRTQVIENFPTNYYKEEAAKLDDVIKLIKKPVEALILLHFGNKISRDLKIMKKLKADEIINENFITDLNILLMKFLRKDISHLSAASVDLKPRIEGFWFVGGFELPKILKNKYEKNDHLKEFANQHYDRCFRSSIRPALALRAGEGLPEVVPLESITGEFTSSNEVVEYNPNSSSEFNPLNVMPHETDPKMWGLTNRRKHAVIIPGFWPGEKDEYGHIFFHTRAFEKNKIRKYDIQTEEIFSHMLTQKAVLAGFTQSLSYAFYQGFTPVNELTYPVVQQYISTDGQKFQFGLYQLNTCCLHSERSLENPRKNYLWLSKDMNLYESIEGDSVKGLNEDVLKMLCSFYLKKGQPRENPSPYLAPYKYLMHHNAPEEYKEEFQEFVHHLLSERPRHRKMPEIAPWEWIYKINFKTRPRDKKFKFFENRWKVNPLTRRLDDYRLQYIPKVRRIAHRIKFKPRINSEHLFKHDFSSLKPLVVFSDDEIVHGSMNVNKNIPPYYNGLLWSRGMSNKQRKI